jgi:hypothetical protein
MDVQRVQGHPAFKQLASERTRFGVGMSVGMAACLLHLHPHHRILSPSSRTSSVEWHDHHLGDPDRRRTNRTRVRDDSRLRTTSKYPLRSSQPTP